MFEIQWLGHSDHSGYQVINFTAPVDSVMAHVPLLQESW